MEEIIHEKRINYYETDKMGIVHHSNYIRFLEEARCTWLRALGMSYGELEKMGIMIPVLGVSVDYKHHVTFEDVIQIKVFVKEFNGVRMKIGYDVREKETGNIVIEAETKHCFTDMNLKPISLKKVFPEVYDLFSNQIKVD